MDITWNKTKKSVDIAWNSSSTRFVQVETLMYGNHLKREYDRSQASLCYKRRYRSTVLRCHKPQNHISALRYYLK